MPQPMRSIPASKTAATVGSIHGRCDCARCQWPSTQSGLPDKQLGGVCVRAMPQIVAQGPRHLCRQGSSRLDLLSPPEPWGFEPPVNVIDAQPGDLDGAKTQINQTDCDGIVPSTFV